MDINTKSKVKQALGNTVARIILLVFFVITVYPFIWATLTSLKTNAEFCNSPFALPTSLNWDNYARAWATAGLDKYVWNSLFVTALTLVFTLVLVIPCSYCLVRYKFPGNRVIMALFLTCLFITGNYILIPLFLQMNKLHLLNSLWGLIIVYSAFRIPYSCFLLTGYLQGIPKDYEEAATLDGCGPFRVLLNVIVPLAKPSVTTIAMLTLMAAWNEYTMAFIMVTDPAKKTLTVGLQALQQVMEYATDWVALFAGLMIAFIPTLFIYAACKNQLMQGVNVGGLKG